MKEGFNCLICQDGVNLEPGEQCAVCLLMKPDDYAGMPEVTDCPSPKLNDGIVPLTPKELDEIFAKSDVVPNLGKMLEKYAQALHQFKQCEDASNPETPNYGECERKHVIKPLGIRCMECNVPPTVLNHPAVHSKLIHEGFVLVVAFGRWGVYPQGLCFEDAYNELKRLSEK